MDQDLYDIRINTLSQHLRSRSDSVCSGYPKRDVAGSTSGELSAPLYTTAVSGG